MKAQNFHSGPIADKDGFTFYRNIHFFASFEQRRYRDKQTFLSLSDQYSLPLDEFPQPRHYSKWWIFMQPKILFSFLTPQAKRDINVLFLCMGVAVTVLSIPPHTLISCAFLRGRRKFSISANQLFSLQIIYRSFLPSVVSS